MACMHPFVVVVVVVVAVCVCYDVHMRALVVRCRQGRVSREGWGRFWENGVGGVGG
jgi:hypothetical protein